MKIIRFNQVQPGLDPVEMSARYKATVDMAQYAEDNGFDMVTLEEHHGAENGWSPSPLITAGLIFGRCSRIPISISALLEPLHDPLRIAEDIAVLDLQSGGRLVIKVTAPPLEGCANEAVGRLVAKATGVSASRVRVVKGERRRDKTLRIDGISLDDAARSLK